MCRKKEKIKIVFKIILFFQINYEPTWYAAWSWNTSTQSNPDRPGLNRISIAKNRYGTVSTKNINATKRYCDWNNNKFCIIPVLSFWLHWNQDLLLNKSHRRHCQELSINKTSDSTKLAKKHSVTDSALLFYVKSKLENSFDALSLAFFSFLNTKIHETVFINKVLFPCGCLIHWK